MGRTLKVTLVSPPNTEFRDAGKAHLVEPLGLAYIAAVLEWNGYGVKIIDADTLGYSVAETVEEILKTSPDVVGFSCQTPLYPIALEIARAIKKASHVITLFGGLQATSFPDIAKDPAIDFSISGEGERPFLDLVRALEGKGAVADIAGIGFFKDGRFVCNPPNRMSNLDESPFPARHLLPMEKYRYSFPVTSKRKTYASVNFSRGCVYGCIFCNSPRQWNRRVVHRSPKNIVEELKELVHKFGVDTFYVRDEVFTLNKKNVLQICEEIVKEKLDVQWFCYARADHLDEEMLLAMKGAGCRVVKIGVETGDPEIMRLIKKGEKLETIERAFELAHRAGLYTHASFMIGHPWDSHETVQRSIEFAKKLNADTVAFPIMTPFPGTEVWDIAKEENLLLTEDFTRFNVIGSSVMRTKYLAAEDLVKLQKKALFQYYFRTAYLGKALRRVITNPKSIKMYLQPAVLLIKWLKGR